MTKQIRIAVLGNCQAQMVETLLCAGNPDIVLNTMQPVFEMTGGMQADVEAKLASADVVFAQRVAPDYQIEWLRIANLRANHKAKLYVWPNIYFDGYFPDVQYVYLDRWGKLQSPLEDYHFAHVIECYREGCGVEETIRRLEEHVPAEDTFEASLARLRTREQDVDVPISDFVASVVGGQRAFYTPNHPYSFVLVEMCRRLAEAAGIPYDPAMAAKSSARLDRIYIPAHRGIRRKHNLPFDRLPLFRGVEIKSVEPGIVRLGDARSVSLQELVASYFRVYDYALSATP